MVSEQTRWWREEATPTDLWNGPGDGVAEHLEQLLLLGRYLGPGALGLDLGCGAGRLLVPMAEAFPAARFVGADVRRWPPSSPWPEACEFMEVDGGGGLGGLAYASVSAAWSVLLFQHLPGTVAARYLAELGRVLRPGGTAVVQWVEAREGIPNVPGRSYRHSMAEMLSWCEAAGLDPCASEQSAFPPDWVWLEVER